MGYNDDDSSDMDDTSHLDATTIGEPYLILNKKDEHQIAMDNQLVPIIFYTDFMDIEKIDSRSQV